MKKVVVMAVAVLPILFCACEKAEVEEPIVPLQLIQHVQVYVNDEQNRDLLSDETYAFKENEIEVRYKKGVSPILTTVLVQPKEVLR